MIRARKPCIFCIRWMKMIMTSVNRIALVLGQPSGCLYIVSTFKKLKKLCVFESDILHILLVNSILSTTKQFREMKKISIF